MSEQQSASAKRKISDNPDDLVILLSDGVKLPASRSSLSNVSDYFSAMFLSGMTESKKEVIEVEIEKELLQLLVDFSSSGKIVIVEEVAVQLLVASIYLQFPKVVAECCNFLKNNLKAENCLRIKNVAFTHFLLDLKQAAHSFVLANFMDVSRTEDFLQLKPDHLKEFLSSDVIMVDSEDDVFEVLLSWFDSNECPAKDIEADLIRTVRFPYLSPATLSKAAENPHFESAKGTLRSLKVGEAVEGYRPRKNTAGILLAVGMDGKHIWDENDPVEDVWKRAGSATAPGEGGRYALADGVLYYAGGVTEYNQSDFRYLDFSQEKWVFGPKLLMARNNHGAVWLERALYVVGGQDKHDENVTNLVEQWRPDSKKWQNVAPLPFPTGFFGLTVLCNKMYVVGGNDESYGTANSVYCFDPHRNAWSTCAPMKFARSEVGAGVLNGILYAVGGNAAGGGRSSEFERYDPRTGKWETLPQMLIPRSEPAVSSLAGEVYVVGGNTKERRVQTVEIYDPSAEKWRTGSSLQSCLEDIQVFHLPRKTSFFRKNIL